MPLYIKDPTVDTLLERYLAVSGLTNKTEAVRRALHDQLKTLAEQEPLSARVARIQSRAAEMGFRSIGSDDPAAQKRHMDELWGED